MLKICTIYFEGCYTPEYVSKLYRSLKRNSTIPFEFICLSDTKNIENEPPRLTQPNFRGIFLPFSFS